MAATSIFAPRIVVTNGMFNSTANLRIILPSRTAPPEIVGTFTINDILPCLIRSRASGCILSLILYTISTGTLCSRKISAVPGVAYKEKPNCSSC